LLYWRGNSKAVEVFCNLLTGVAFIDLQTFYFVDCIHRIDLLLRSSPSEMVNLLSSAEDGFNITTRCHRPPHYYRPDSPKSLLLKSLHLLLKSLLSKSLLLKSLLLMSPESWSDLTERPHSFLRRLSAPAAPPEVALLWL